MPEEKQELSIKKHVQLAHRHIQLAVEIAYGRLGDEPQEYWIRRGLSQVQSILTSMIVNKRLK